MSPDNRVMRYSAEKPLSDPDVLETVLSLWTGLSADDPIGCGKCDWSGVVSELVAGYSMYKSRPRDLICPECGSQVGSLAATNW